MKNVMPTNFRVCKDNIIRDNKYHPRVDNAVYQELVFMKQNGENMTGAEEALYGQCILTLVEIILNGPKFKFQDDDIKSECRTDAYIAICEGVPRYFKKDAGSKAVSYAYRVGYTAMIHVLEAHDRRADVMNRIEEAYDEMFCHQGGKVCTSNL